MSVMVTELYAALRAAGVNETQAAEAARAVLLEARSELATKADVVELRLSTKADLAELKADLLKWVVSLLLAQVGLFSAIVGLMKVFG